MKRVLVVDDDEKILLLIQRWLDKLGCETITATNGKTALDIQQENPADLIITDLFMPEKEGTELLLDIRDEFPATKVIVMSGGGANQSVDYLELASLLGAVKVFQKPFEMQELMDTIQEILGN